MGKCFKEMNELLDVEIILKRKDYPKIYNIGIIMMIIMLIFLLIGSIYDYQTYLIIDSQVVDNKLELLIKSDEVKYIVNGNYLFIGEEKYSYKVVKINDKLIYGIDKKIYQYVYLDVSSIKKIDNFIYQVRFLKEKKKLIKYLENYI